jgi:hypothetical protein
MELSGLSPAEIVFQRGNPAAHSSTGRGSPGLVPLFRAEPASFA